MSEIDEIKKSIEEIKKRLRRIEDALEIKLGVPVVLMEKRGVVLVDTKDFFGTYAVIDRKGNVHHYADLKYAVKILNRLAEEERL